MRPRENTLGDGAHKALRRACCVWRIHAGRPTGGRPKRASLVITVTSTDEVKVSIGQSSVRKIGHFSLHSLWWTLRRNIPNERLCLCDLPHARSGVLATFLLPVDQKGNCACRLVPWLFGCGAAYAVNSCANIDAFSSYDTIPLRETPIGAVLAARWEGTARIYATRVGI